MKTVPTLCATATVVGISSVGYALGRPEQPQFDRPSTSKRKHSTSPLGDQPMPSQLVTGLPNAPLDQVSPRSPGADALLPTRGRPSLDGRNGSHNAQKQSIAEGSVHKQAGTDVESSRASVKSSLDLGSRLTLRSRPSWMKRLSTMSSVGSNSSFSLRPESPTNQIRNETPSYLRRGSSIAPSDSQHSSRPPSRLSPNKLVKRSASQRFSNDTPSISRVSSVRRPITSHERSPNSRRSAGKSGSPFTEHPALETTEVAKDTIVEDLQTDGNVRWRQFFSVKVSGTRTTSKETAGRDRRKETKRIVPEDGCFPTLIMTKSILTSALEVKERYDPDDDSIFFGSRPSSAYLDALPFGMEECGPMPAKRLSRPSMEPRQSVENVPRRSFSLHEFLSLGPSSQKSTPTPPRNLARRLSRKAARRVFSEPLAVLGIGRPSADIERPPKRRDITDPSIFQKSTPSQPTTHHQDTSTSAGGIGAPNSPFTLSSETRSQDSRSENRSPSIPQQSPFLGTLKLDGISHSPILPQASMRTSENSAAASERASTLVGSDSDMRGTNTGDEDDTEFGGETLYDSVRTRTTRSASGARDHRIETIFDESPPARKVGGILMRDNNLLTKHFIDAELFYHEQEDIIEEEESVATPVRTIRSDRADDGSPINRRLHLRARSRSPLPSRSPIPSSPPEMPKPLSLGTLEYDDDLMEEDEESKWSCLDEEEPFAELSSRDDWGIEEVATPLAMTKTSPLLIATGNTPISRLDADFTRDFKRDTMKSSIFDWSEHTQEKSPGNCSPPRPRTVHGKKDTDHRGSRSVGRRAPSALHVRSQSVPVVPDVSGKREAVVTNKFGTWGVGSKGVSEDWDDDFDFGDNEDPTGVEDREEKRVDSGVVMHIPQTIRERQANVVNNIGLVKEFGMLVEELKMLRTRAVHLGLFEDDGPLHDISDEIDGVIELADQDTDDLSIPRHLSPPSSPGFDQIAFNEPSDAAPSSEIRATIARRCVSGSDIVESTITPIGTRARRATVLSSDGNVFGTPIVNQTQNRTTMSSDDTSHRKAIRPRKDSEAIARSVIEALKRGKNSNPKSLSLQPVPSNQRIPFDTTTLSRIVPLVTGLVRRVKQQIRDTEKLDLSRNSSPIPSAAPTDPPLTNIFRNPGRPRATSASALSDPFQPIDEMTTQMKVMTVM